MMDRPACNDQRYKRDTVKKKPQTKPQGKKKSVDDDSDDDFSDIDAANDDYFDEQVEIFSSTPLAAGGMEARRAIELAREVNLCVRYLSVTFGVHKPDAIWLAGHNATGHVGEQLSDALHSEVRTADQSPRLREIDLPGSEPAQFCVAMGLATRHQPGSAQRGAA